MAFSINDRYRIALARPGSEGRNTSSLENPSQWLIDLFRGPDTASGVAVNDLSALSLAAVYTCCKILSESVASLPIGLHRLLPGGGSEPATDRPENNLIAYQPSALYHSYNFRSTIQLHLGLRGNGFARIYRNGSGGGRELRIMHPDFVTPFLNEGKLYYRIAPHVQNGFVSETLMSYEVLHLTGLSNDGITGVSPIQSLRESIGMAIANRQNQSKTLKKGRVDGILKHPSKLTTEQVTSVRDNFSKPVQEGRFPLLENGLEYQAVSLSPADAEFIETAKLTSRDIFGAYRIPLHMGGDLERATFSNIEHQSLEFVKFTLMPWLRNWEQELDRKLLPASLQGQYYFRFNVEGLLRGDIRARMEAYTKAIQWGILNRDEVRALENRNPIDGGLGEIFLTPLNMAPLTEESLQPPDDQQNNDNNGEENQPASAR